MFDVTLIVKLSSFRALPTRRSHDDVYYISFDYIGFHAWSYDGGRREQGEGCKELWPGPRKALKPIDVGHKTPLDNIETCPAEKGQTATVAVGRGI